jgi:hypothetical protein
MFKRRESVFNLPSSFEVSTTNRMIEIACESISGVSRVPALGLLCVDADKRRPARLQTATNTNRNLPTTHRLLTHTVGTSRLDASDLPSAGFLFDLQIAGAA